MALIVFNIQLTLAQRKAIWVQLKIDFPGLTERVSYNENYLEDDLASPLMECAWVTV